MNNSRSTDYEMNIDCLVSVLQKRFLSKSVQVNVAVNP